MEGEHESQKGKKDLPKMRAWLMFIHWAEEKLPAGEPVLGTERQNCYLHATLTSKAEYDETIDDHHAFVQVTLEGWGATINDGEKSNPTEEDTPPTDVYVQNMTLTDLSRRQA